MKKAKAHLVIVTMISRPQQFTVHLKLYGKTQNLLILLAVYPAVFFPKRFRGKLPKDLFPGNQLDNGSST